MKNLHELDTYRVCTQQIYELYGGFGDDKTGVFEISYQNNSIYVIASALDGWDHVSVSLKNRTPNWYEMKHIAKLFFRPSDIAVQYFVPEKDYVNNVENCLHWWRPHFPQTIPVPPIAYV